MKVRSHPEVVEQVLGPVPGARIVNLLRPISNFSSETLSWARCVSRLPLDPRSRRIEAPRAEKERGPGEQKYTASRARTPNALVSIRGAAAVSVKRSLVVLTATMPTQAFHNTSLRLYSRGQRHRGQLRG